MNSDEAEKLVREMIEVGDETIYREPVKALLDFHEQNKAIIGDRDRELADLQEQLNALGNEADAARTKVTEQAHEIERLRGEQKLDGAEIERLQKVVADQALTIATLKDQSGRVHAAYNAEGYLTELGRLREEAQTSRLALDVALKEVEALKAEQQWFERLDGKLRKHQWYYDYLGENPKPGAAT